ncbi:MAG: hypothetical protein RLY49_493 [Candidatus Parcubacteria bacterium]|jgi:RecB family exonuclease
MDDLRDDNLEETENADALLDDSIFEETDLDILGDDEELKTLTDDTGAVIDPDEEEGDEEILDELDALAAEEDDEEGFDFYGDEDDY